MPRQVPLPAAPVTMVELSTKVARTLNKTTPGLQIWRIEVGTGGTAWGPIARAPITGLGWGLQEGRSPLCVLSAWFWGIQCGTQG